MMPLGDAANTLPRGYAQSRRRSFRSPAPDRLDKNPGKRYTSVRGLPRRWFYLGPGGITGQALRGTGAPISNVLAVCLREGGLTRVRRSHILIAALRACAASDGAG